MRELAVRPVGLTPLLEQGQDLLGLLGQQAVHRGPARRPVREPAPGPAGEPAMGPDLAELKHSTGASDRPTGLDRFVDQVQQAGLGDRIDTAWDVATQPQPPYLLRRQATRVRGCGLFAGLPASRRLPGPGIVAEAASGWVAQGAR